MNTLVVQNNNISIEEARQLVSRLPETQADIIAPALQGVKSSGHKVAWIAAGGAVATAGLTGATFSSKVKGKYKWLTGIGAVISATAAVGAGLFSALVHKAHSEVGSELNRFFNDLKTNPQLAEDLAQVLSRTMTRAELIDVQHGESKDSVVIAHVLNMIFEFGEPRGYFNFRGSDKDWSSRCVPCSNAASGRQ